MRVIGVSLTNEVLSLCLNVHIKKYQEKGEAGLLDRRGKRRPPAEYSEEEKAAAKLRKLEVENRRLQMENDFLKKLNELEGRR